jgi:hypothetical protein
VSGGINVTYDTPLDSPSVCERGDLISRPPWNGILTREVRFITAERVEARKNELGGQASEQGARLVLLGKDIGHIMCTRDVVDSCGFEPNTVPDPDLPYVHMAEAFGEGGTSAPVDRRVIQPGRSSVYCPPWTNRIPWCLVPWR